jgi:threonine dehydrogenase-like Zn-dependent dehydrogenase
MRAARYDARSGRLDLVDVPVPEPGPQEVLVRVQACGICLSDVHLIEGSLPGSLPQVVPGHEAAGVIAKVGENVPGWQSGQRVVMSGGRPCGRCRTCARGLLGECPHFQVMGFAYDGAWAEYVVAPYAGLAAVPDSVPIEQAAILADAVATPYAALTARAALRPGEAIGLWGIGGLGVHAVQIARLVGASPIIALDPLPASRARALASGADHALDPTAEDVRQRGLDLTGGLGLRVAVDLVGSNRVLAQADDCLGRFGRLVMVGLSAEPIALGQGVFFGTNEHTLLGHLGYQKRHLDELVDLVSAGRLDVSRSVSDVIPLEDIHWGVERLRTKQGDPIRIVVKPTAA